MSRRSETWNAYESKLAGPLPSLSTSVSIESTAGLDDPAYFVIDPDKPTLREWIRVGTITPGLFENIVRNQEGSVGNIDHETGAIVRAVFTKQLQDDIFDDVEDIEGAVTSHVNPVQQPDPHSQYLLESQGEDLYVPLAGNPNDAMTGALHLRISDPTDDEEATKKSYVDGGLATHTAIDAAHHVRYADSEARTAVDDGTYLKLAGGKMTGTLRITADTASIDWDEADGSFHYGMKYYSGTEELSLWSEARGERVLRFLDDGEIQLRPFNNQPLTVDGDLLVRQVTKPVGGIVWENNDLSDAFSMNYYNENDLGIWSNAKGERVLRFFNDGRIYIRPFNNQPVTIEDDLQVNGKIVNDLSLDAHLIMRDVGLETGGTGLWNVVWDENTGRFHRQAIV
ncbi:MAG: hypothetical protein M3132_12115 [Actinomycetia bacterium]|nr:hypothetical protein [Actinomycetes bacterium]